MWIFTRFYKDAVGLALHYDLIREFVCLVIQSTFLCLINRGKLLILGELCPMWSTV